jgi:hypothetical protein
MPQVPPSGARKFVYKMPCLIAVKTSGKGFVTSMAQAPAEDVLPPQRTDRFLPGETPSTMQGGRSRPQSMRRLLSQALLLVTSQTITPITRMTRTAPTQTPALKISPITSQPVKDIVERSKNTNRNQECFMVTAL